MGYKVELIPSGESGARVSMWRCGVKFNLGEPQTLELTKEQAEVFENDWRFKITHTTDTSSTLETSPVAESETVLSADTTATETVDVDETEVVEDQAVAREEKKVGIVTVAELLKEHSREELNIYAGELGIESPELYANKTEVAQAIVDSI